MPTEVIMPKVDMDMASGKIMCWLVAPGEAVDKGAPLFEIETDKAAMEVEAPASGILHHPAPEGATIAIGAPVAWLYAPDEAVGEAPEAAPDVAASEAVAAEPDYMPTPPTPDEPSADKPRATPRARSLAREAGVDLREVPGSGPRGRVQGADVLAQLDAVPAAPAAPRFGALSITRKPGGTGTPIVLLHGFASDATSWAPLEQDLDSFTDRPMIRIDLPGHGRSPALEFADFATLSKLLRQAFDSLCLERAALIGHSLGGALALALADTRPRIVERLSLIAPAGLGAEINGTVLDGLGRARQPASLKPWLKHLVADETRITDSYARLVAAARSDEIRAAQTRMAEALFPDGTQAFDLRAALARIEVPTQILWGKADRIIPWRHALRARGEMALHLFDDVGHMPQMEAPERVARVIAG